MSSVNYVTRRWADKQIIDARAAVDEVKKSRRRARGRVPRDWSVCGYGAHPYSKPFDGEIVPAKDWPDRVREMDENELWASNHARLFGVDPFSQSPTNFCWANAPVMAVQIIGVAGGMPYDPLSPASVACKINGFVNQGGWGGDALREIIANGVAPQTHWPANAIDRKYDNAETRAARLKYRVTEWYEIQNRHIEQLVSVLLLGIPVAIGLNWWRHEVLATAVVALGNGKFGIEFLNSWGASYGEQGYSVLSLSQATPDDAVCPTVPMLR